MEDELMIQTDLPADQEVMEPQMEEAEPLPIQVLYLTNNLILVSQIDEVLADIGQPDCKLTNPFWINTESGTTVLHPFLTGVTKDDTFMMSSDKILTLAEPTPTLLEKYQDLIKE